MLQKPLSSVKNILIKVFKLLIIIGLTSFLSSCNKFQKKAGKVQSKQLEKADSVIIAGDLEAGKQMIYKLRPGINTDDALISNYYCHRSELSNNTPDAVTYADSAIAYFDTKSRIKNNPNEYRQALITKGDAYVSNKNYISALNYYYNAQHALPAGQCDNGAVAEKIANIYYNQKSYKKGAQYWAQSYRLLSKCNVTYTTQKAFFQKQTLLDNAGFAFLTANILDSSAYYLQLDLKLIADAEKINLVDRHNIDASRIVVYDNLGGLNLKTGNLQLAKSYLDKAMAIPYHNHVDGMLLPVLIKLADIHLKTNELKKAGDAFKQAQILLALYASENRDSQLKYYSLYAQYLFKTKRYNDAYALQGRYIILEDSLNKSSADLYKLDVSREFYNINQKQTLTDLAQKDQIKQIYLAGIVTALLLFTGIIILINRNLIQTKRNNIEANLRNQQLQLTLNELERVNKNYIRIMRVMAHDIINPLSGMTGIASMLMLADISEDNIHMLKLIESTGLNSMEMINELLKSGLSNNDEQVEKQPTNIRALLFDSIELLQFKANDKNQQIIFDFDETPVIANINHEKMWRVFNNLIVNAIKFSHEGSTVRVGITHMNNNILISIADNGIGIPDKDKETVFEMFTSAKKAGTNGEQPFGLGLSISKKIVEIHHGKIWFESRAGTGTTFYIELPVFV